MPTISIEPGFIINVLSVLWCSYSFSKFLDHRKSVGLVSRVIDTISASFLVFAGSFAHELAHYFVARLVGIPLSNEIALTGLGMRIGFLDPEELQLNIQFLAVAAAGPIMQLIVAGMFFSKRHIAFRSAALLSLAVGFYNLLPFSDLDGGKILAVILTLIGYSADTVYYISYLPLLRPIAQVISIGIVLFALHIAKSHTHPTEA